MLRLPPTLAMTCLPLAVAPLRCVSPPEVMVSWLSAVTWLACILQPISRNDLFHFLCSFWLLGGNVVQCHTDVVAYFLHGVISRFGFDTFSATAFMRPVVRLKMVR